MIPADRRELLHLRPHPPGHPSSPAIRAIQIAGNHRQVGPIHVVITGAACREDGAKSARHHSTPATTQKEPLQAVPLGPTQAVIASTRSGFCPSTSSSSVAGWTKTRFPCFIANRMKMAADPIPVSIRPSNGSRAMTALVSSRNLVGDVAAPAPLSPATPELSPATSATPGADTPHRAPKHRSSSLPYDCTTSAGCSSTSAMA